VEKDLFIEVLKHYADSSEEEALEVLMLKENFPYSQLLRTLAARLSKDHGFIDQSKELQFAAVYAADRSVLKDIMTLDDIVIDLKPKPKTKSVIKPGTTPVEILVEIKEAAPASQMESIETNAGSVIVTDDESPDPGSLAEEVMNDLEKLHQLKHNFEMLFVDSGSTDTKVVLEQTTGKEPHSIMAELTDTEEVAGQQSAKSKRERIIELARALESSKKTELSEDLKVPPSKSKRLNRGENIIEDIVSTKHEIAPESDKQKEQLEIIDQFIKIQPSISNSKDKPIEVPPGDLSTIKTGEFGDNIVSETLVEILLKQGKKDKAIEVLKKLIWKFPQKKAYFAAQIEELKK
jgi:hypothetical protein